MKSVNCITTSNKGKWLRECPCTPGHVGCGYFVIENMLGCPYTCTYCYLNHYQNSPPTVYTNTDDLIRELKSFFEKTKKLRIGTGEFSDSLAWDDRHPFSKILVPFFAEKQNHFLELKTKSINIGNLLELDPKGKTIVSWSVNPEVIAKAEEKNCPSLTERLNAAKTVAENGYFLAFHFDPIINIENWQKEYADTVRQIFESVDPKKILYISLGALRFPASMKKTIEEKFPDSRITLGELIPGTDQKLRYFKPIRIEMFQNIYQEIRKYRQDVFVYLCMESREVWDKVGIKNENPIAEYFQL